MSKSKKFQPIKDHIDLVVGNYYLRAVVNRHGEYWVDVYKVIKKPALHSNNRMEKNQIFCYLPIYKTARPCSNNHVSVFDSAGYYKNGCDTLSHHFKNFHGKVLFPFSNKVYNYLNSQKTLKDFIQALNPDVKITDEMMTALNNDFERQKWTDDKIHEALLHDEATMNSPSKYF